MKISKTSRILSVFHLFLQCEEVTYKEITDLMPVSEKTIYRDICLLRQSGVINPQFSKKQNAFILPPSECPPPIFPENKSQKLYLEMTLWQLLIFIMIVYIFIKISDATKKNR